MPLALHLPYPRIPLKASMQTPPPRADQTVAMVANLLLLSIMEAARPMTPLPAAQLAIRDTITESVTSSAAYCILLTHEMPLHWSEAETLTGVSLAFGMASWAFWHRCMAQCLWRYDWFHWAGLWVLCFLCLRLGFLRLGWVERAPPYWMYYE